MVMDLLPKLKCLQNIREHLPILSQTRLAVLADGYGARCAGSFDLRYFFIGIHTV
jgi:hypothetical protein